MTHVDDQNRRRPGHLNENFKNICILLEYTKGNLKEILSSNWSQRLPTIAKWFDAWGLFTVSWAPKFPFWFSVFVF